MGIGNNIIHLFFACQADQSGTIVEIIAEDGKPVSVDMVFIFPFLIHFHFDDTSLNLVLLLFCHLFSLQPLLVIQP